MRENTVTIILPTYNRRNFLPTALKCIQEQTFQNWICLVINDGGDDVADLIQATADERFKYYIVSAIN